uniref:KAT8 regulatory NSL complex subunit 1-like protein (Trinotate prediction) n=1 Tax=Myxobolus squamalis TaxID=59785 RepID=A0A6B2FWE6_MYXSQ
MKSNNIGQKPFTKSKYLNIFHPKSFSPADEFSTRRLTLSSTKAPLLVDNKSFRKSKSTVHLLPTADIHNGDSLPPQKLKKMNAVIKTPTPPRPATKISPKRQPKDQKNKNKRKFSTPVAHLIETFESGVIPFSPCTSTRIEQIKYSEISTPSWKKFKPSQLSPDICLATLEENMSDEAFISRNRQPEIDERNKYIKALQFGGRYNKKRNQNNSKQSVKAKNKQITKSSVDPCLSLNISLYNEDSTHHLFS